MAETLGTASWGSIIGPVSFTDLQDSRDLLQETFVFSGLDITERIIVDFSAPSIAKGGYSEVYRGTYCKIDGNKVKVAVKRLHLYLVDDPGSTKLIAKEIKTWSKLAHRNIVPLFGFIICENGFPALVSEWMDNGSVLQYVRSHPEHDVIHLILGVAEGLAYLHEEDVVHADVKSGNVLVNSSGDAVICDFGISQAINSPQVALASNTALPNGAVGSIRWLSYELLAQSEIYTKHTKESDVWAFGMTAYELLAKEPPYAEITIEAQVIISVMRKKLPTPPLSFSTWPKKKQEALKICELCWTIDPKSRISMPNVVKKLKDLSFKYPEPEDYLKETLDKLSHLNVTNHVTIDFSAPGVGGNAFGDFFVGNYMPPGRDRLKVAIWRMRPDLRDRSVKLLAKDIYIRSKLAHPNIDPLLGFILDDSGFPSTVSKWMDNGSVLQFVKNHPDSDILHLILGIAKGLEYLHENDVVHADIKSDNILVTPAGDAVIRGFEISRAMNATQAFLGGNTTHPNGPAGTVRWMAYELINEAEKYTKHTKESDVWAFGMTVYELLAKERPYAHVVSDIMVIIDLTLRKLPSRPISFDSWPRNMQDVWYLCETCWIFDPQHRISMKDAVNLLERWVHFHILTYTTPGP
ncbi:hypothetical protein M0805_009155 [Coniferiporia weirii]|nr:hypothetical protein M0805_009155 [Coniferiporia weirii]